MAELEIQYKDISDWSAKRSLTEQKEYWLEKFPEQPQSLELYLDFTRPQKRSYAGKNIEYLVNIELMNKIKTTCQQKGVTEAAFFLATFMVLLSKYSLTDEIVLGMPVEGRKYSQMQNVVGMFVNTLLMKGDVQKTGTFQTLLSETQEQFLQALENQEYLFEELVDAIGTHLDSSRNPLFDVMFAFQNNEKSSFELTDCQTTVMSQENTVAKFDLLLEVEERQDTYQLTWEYATDLFKENTIGHMGRHFIELLEEVTKSTEIQIKDLSMNGSKDLALAKTFSLPEELSTITATEQADTILTYFAEQVQTKKDYPAIWYQGQIMTYGELDEKTNQLANTILSHGIKQEERIAISTEKNPEALVALLAILKAGGAYLSVDLKNPISRINYILQDSNCTLFLKGKTELPEGINQNLKVLHLFNASTYAEDASRPDVEVVTDQLACVIYTSGTTGNPKGVMLEHKSILRLVKKNHYIDFENIKLIPTGAMSFDASTFEIWTPLLNGGQLFLLDEDEITDVEKVYQVVTSQGINTLFLTVALFNQFVDLKEELFQELNYVLTGGEQLSEYHVKKFLDGNQTTELINCYGPTEGTTFALTYSFNQGMRSPIPIGRPIEHAEAYIMQDGILCGINVPGELYLGGACVTRGYQNRPELTAESFIPNPFGTGTIYATGDIARMSEDGYIEFFGRKDNQVKIRGFRIELAEIETQLKSLPAIQDAVVAVKKVNDEKYIAAYIIEKERIEVEMIQDQLREFLPDYAIPTKIMKLEQFPLTGNGKLDFRALPEIKQEEQVLEEPQNLYEEHVLRAFIKVFDNDKLGTETDFFEIGGHSLRAAKLVNYIEKYSGVQLNVGSVMKERTIKRIAKVLEEKESNSQPDFMDMMAITEEEI